MLGNLAIRQCNGASREMKKIRYRNGLKRFIVDGRRIKIFLVELVSSDV